jgi:hypothetical protein
MYLGSWLCKTYATRKASFNALIFVGYSPVGFVPCKDNATTHGCMEGSIFLW